MSRNVYCIKLKDTLPGLDRPPIPGILGQKIFDNVSKEAWGDWIKHQTMLINENRLNLTEEVSRKYLLKQLEYYFFSDQ